MAQRLIIKWKYLPGMLPPYSEKLFCKTVDAAREILSRRNKINIESAVWMNRVDKVTLI